MIEFIFWSYITYLILRFFWRHANLSKRNTWR